MVRAEDKAQIRCPSTLHSEAGDAQNQAHSEAEGGDSGRAGQGNGRRGHKTMKFTTAWELWLVCRVLSWDSDLLSPPPLYAHSRPRC